MGMTKAVLTVIGQDRVGIIAAVSRMLADANVNILDISQTTMQEIFTMTMLVDVTAVTDAGGGAAGSDAADCGMAGSDAADGGTAGDAADRAADGFRALSEALAALGDAMNLKIQLRHVDIFNAMHKI